jgi:ribosomal protein S12 methylthiotransferase accessory factor
MASASPILITLPGGRRVDAQLEHHLIRTDQPKGLGGEASAPAPFDLFLASIGTCAGVFIQGFCAKRGIPYESIRIIERPEYDQAGTLAAVSLDIELPADFPPKYREAVVKVAEQCTVKRAILAQPLFRVQATQPATEEAPTTH